MIGSYVYVYVVLPHDAAVVGETTPVAVCLSRKECREAIATMGIEPSQVRIRRARASIYSS